MAIICPGIILAANATNTDDAGRNVPGCQADMLGTTNQYNAAV